MPRNAQTEYRLLIWAVLYTIPAALMLLMENYVMGVIGHQTPDAVVYLSIADNFVNNGHFIQTARDVKGMIVPPGTPLMLTVYRLLHFSNRMVLVIHILMFGTANVLLYETERRINGSGIWAPIIYTMANLRCWIILGDAIVEHYYLFLLCLGLWVVYREISARNKIICLNIIGLALVLVRPILIVVYCVILGISFLWVIRNKTVKTGLFIIMMPIMIIGLNVAVNYRETGEFVLLENYSGSDMYVASRYDAPVMIEGAENYMDDVYLDIVQSDSRTMQERNQLFKELAKENIRNHFGRYLFNGILRGHEMFLKVYAWATLYTLVGGILLSKSEGDKGNYRSTVILILTIVLALISSFGVSEARYSIIIWPMASIHGAYLTHLIQDAVFRENRL